MQYLEISEEVKHAHAENQGVVALESTIISHGMPFPKNIETARAVEAEVRRTGAVPATMAVINGKLKAGLSNSELELLGRDGKQIVKCSRRDLPFVSARRMNGATTVAATMIIAEMAGIKVFATGGIGGVHRGGPQSFDISADLQELSQSNVAVVSAGAKSILDIGLTLEYLETHGVPVIGFGTDQFPAFYIRDSGHDVDYRYDDEKNLAAALHGKWAMGLDGGVIIANPVPAEFELENRLAQKAIDTAVEEAVELSVSGKELTPWLLSRIEEITGGESVKSNVQLVLNNASLAGRIAVELAAIERDGELK